VNVPIRRMWKVVGDYKDQRREQKRIIDRLHAVTEGQTLRQKAEEAALAAAAPKVQPVPAYHADLKGFGGGFFAASSKPKEASGAPADRNQQARLAQLTGLDIGDLEELQRLFQKAMEASDHVSRSGFTRLLQALCPQRSFTDPDTEAWWLEVRNLPEPCIDEKGRGGSVPTDSQNGKKSVGGRAPSCSFNKFAAWWASSELRTSSN